MEELLSRSSSIAWIDGMSASLLTGRHRLTSSLAGGTPMAQWGESSDLVNASTSVGFGSVKNVVRQFRHIHSLAYTRVEP